MSGVELFGIKKVFLINLKRREDRLKKFLSNKNFLPEFEVFEAIDGKELKYDNNYNLQHFNNKILENKLTEKINHLKVGELGCFLSHYFIWKKIIELNNPCLVFEDDAKPSKDFSIKLNNILKKGIPENFDIIWIGLTQHYVQNKIYDKKIKPNKNKFINDHFYNYLDIPNNQFYTYCYIISPNCCQKLCYDFEKSEKKFPAVDHFICSKKFNNNYILINCDNNDGSITVK